MKTLIIFICLAIFSTIAFSGTAIAENPIGENVEFSIDDDIGNPIIERKDPPEDKKAVPWWYYYYFRLWW